MKFLRTSLAALCGFLMVSFLVTSCVKDEEPTVSQVADYDAEAALKWNQMFLDVERYSTGYRPGPAPRALAYMGLAAYEACVSGMPEYNSIRSLYPGLVIPEPEKNAKYHWPTVVHFVYEDLMHKFFPNPPSEMYTRMSALENSLEDKYQAVTNDKNYNISKAYGQAVADAVWEWSKTDAIGHDAYLNPFGTYDWQAHYDAPGNWVPTDPGPGKPLFPTWGNTRTFAILPADKLCKAPLQYSESTQSAIYAQALEVYNAIHDDNWEDGQWIAQFWSDDIMGLTFSPGPRWISIANQVISKDNSNLQTALYAYVKLGLALNDACVSCWYSKYVYNYERPASYIHRLIDQNWKPTLDNPLTGETGLTPSFPTYPSGHSTMGGAAAEVLTNVFGNHFGMLDRSHEGRTEFQGTPRFFNNFYEMAQENALSRIPLGVHFRMDCEVGVDLGYLCGRRVNNLPWKK
ncbi:MAG: phosphatase PAP2 family protein [Bacteroidetes bacterium]|nr:phosphatase PAP2 family protein [Bacteroidota bacterium]